MYAFLLNKVCVKECPTQTTSLYAYAVAKNLTGDLPIDQIPGFPDFDLDFQRSLCVPYLTDADWEDAIKGGQNGTKLRTLINKKKCPAYTIASIGIAQRCVPDFGLIPDGVENGTTVTDENKNDIQKGDGTKVDFGDVIDSIKAIIELMNLQTIAENILSDVVKTKWMLLLGLGISKTFTFPVPILTFLSSGFAISFLWIFLMRFIAGVMIWLSLGLTIALLALSSAYTWMKYSDLKGVPDAEGSIFDVNPISQVVFSFSGSFHLFSSSGLGGLPPVERNMASSLYHQRQPLRHRSSHHDLPPKQAQNCHRPHLRGLQGGRQHHEQRLLPHLSLPSPTCGRVLVGGRSHLPCLLHGQKIYSLTDTEGKPMSS